MEPWEVTDSELTIAATHWMKINPFSGEVANTHTLLPDVLIQHSTTTSYFDLIRLRILKFFLCFELTFNPIVGPCWA